MDLKAHLAEQKNIVDSRIKKLSKSWRKSSGRDGSIATAMEYSLTAGGKRIRPILAMSSYRGCGGTDERAWRAAVALELIHTYTLIHDDLPSMDDDDFRRGMPTCHRKYGVRTATLAGSSMLLAAFEELAACCRELKLGDIISAVAMASVASSVGGGGVIGGQVVDLESERREIGRETLHYIHSHKTAALLRVSCTLGGVLAGAGRDKLKALAAYGEDIGLAFQIVDDLLDVEGDSAQLGKTAGADQARGKATFPSLYGLEESRRLAAGAVDRSCTVLSKHGLDPDGVLAALARYILKRSS